MTPDERARILAAVAAAAAAAPPLTPAQRDQLNLLMRPAMRTVMRTWEVDDDDEIPPEH